MYRAWHQHTVCSIYEKKTPNDFLRNIRQHGWLLFSIKCNFHSSFLFHFLAFFYMFHEWKSWCTFTTRRRHNGWNRSDFQWKSYCMKVLWVCVVFRLLFLFISLSSAFCNRHYWSIQLDFNIRNTWFGRSKISEKKDKWKK